jgi:ketosteroid isomerase-like protein
MSANVQLVQEWYAALARGDVPAVLAPLDANVQWTEAEGFPCAGVYEGPEAVAQGVLGPLTTEWDGFGAVPGEFIDGGDTVVATGRYAGTYKATGKSFACDFAHVWTLRDGKAVRFKQYVDSALVQEAMRP